MEKKILQWLDKIYSSKVFQSSIKLGQISLEPKGRLIWRRNLSSLLEVG